MKIIKGENIAEFLSNCGIPSAFINYNIAPQIITYNFKLKNPQQIKKALTLEKALTNWSGTPTQCTNANGFLKITTPTPERQTVNITQFKDIKTAPPFSVILGVDENGNNKTKTLDQLTHLLIAGTTGSGKSVCINSIIMGLACYNKPTELGLILIDPKKVEFNIYNNLPHLLTPVITEAEEAEKVFNALILKMEARYNVLQGIGKEKNEGEFKKIVVVIDELADLVLANKNIKDKLIKLLQKSRAAGIHFITATQSPRATILNGLLLANLPSRIALTCASARESILILGHKGAEKLTGKGDAIIKTPDSTQESRIQIPLITKQQIKKLINN